jgi:hypothetical protein
LQQPVKFQNKKLTYFIKEIPFMESFFVIFAPYLDLIKIIMPQIGTTSGCLIIASPCVIGCGEKKKKCCKKFKKKGKSNCKRCPKL